MKAKTKKIKRVLYLIIIFVSVFFIIWEIYFRYFTNYNEPFFDKQNKIIKRKANTKGQYKTEYTDSGFFNINNEGWNSWRDYYHEKEDSILRIALIGHSNVEGLRITYDRIFSKICEDKLREYNIANEIYTFGFGNMHFAQALHVSRYVIENYHPDIVFICTSSDDYIYSITEYSYFLSLHINDDDKIEEKLPFYSYKKYYSSKSPLSILYFSRLINHLDTRFNVGKKIANVYLEIISKLKKDEYIPYANILNKHNKNLKNEEYQKKVIRLREYIYQQFDTLRNKEKVQIKFIGFPISVASYNQFYYDSNLLNKYRIEIKAQIEQHNFSFLDLTNYFNKDYELNKVKFDFEGDGHFNEYAHNLIGNVIADYIYNEYCSQ